MISNHDEPIFKMGNKSNKANIHESVIYKDNYTLPNGTKQHFLLEIDREEVMKELACSKDEAIISIDAVVRSMWRIKTWNL
jgi:hypothetical protein